MTSKRLGIALIALAAVWSLAGLDWIAPSSRDTAPTVLSVGTARAGIFDGQSNSDSNALEGDPDEFGNAPEGDPDEYGDSPADSTSSTSSSSGTDKSGSLLDMVLEFFGGLFGGTR